MRAAWCVLALVAGCSYQGEYKCTQDAECRLGDQAGTCEVTGFCSVADPACTSGRGYDDTAGDGLAGTCVQGPAGCEMWSPHYFVPCALPGPSGNLTLTSGGFTFDTTDGSVTDTAGTLLVVPSRVINGMRIFSVQDVSIATGTTLRAVGMLPLVIASWGTIQMNGVVDASSRTLTGAGSDPADCDATNAADGEDAGTSGGGGGGGGGFAGKGGDGGHAGGTGAGAAGGQAVAMPTTLRGGCAGGASGHAGSKAMPPATATTRAAGGIGGGAVLLSARLAVTIDGAIAASGEGGGGTIMGAQSGGGGGGAGGLIAIEGGTVAIHGLLVAAGGGGGGTASSTLAAAKGADGQVVGTPITAAAGGASETACAGDGGAGNGTAPAGASGGAGTCGGAGGGGGAGFIFLFSKATIETAGATIGPVSQMNPF